MAIKMKIWHIPQIPGPSFEHEVSGPEEGARLINILAMYDEFEFKHRIKPDYSNASGLMVFEDGEWIDWQGDNGETLDDLRLS